MAKVACLITPRVDWGNLSLLWAPGDCREEEENGMVAESDTFPLLFVVKLSVN